MLKKREEKKLMNIVCMTKREIREIAIEHAVYNTTTIITRDQNDGSGGGRR